MLLAASVAQAAQAPKAPATPFKRDGKTPIDITADALEVLQAENQAIFTGHVVAIQGDVRLTSEKMIVHYRERSKEEKSKNAGSQDAIRKIEVERNVFLTTPEETASGDTGVYDVERHEIRLNTNVVLTKEKNTLKGDHLVYDFNTGKSTLTADKESDSHPADKGKTKPRVRALFIPDNGDKIQPDETPKPAAQP